MTNPQVINGQQTTRTLARNAVKSGKASVLVKVIRVPRTTNSNGNAGPFESLVSQIVAATNWQNAIRPSDLMSNDRKQIEIEREMRKQNYWYVRKRQTKGEARRLAGSQKYILLRKGEVAQAVAACELESSVVREGKEGLFEEHRYSRVLPCSDPWFYLTRYRLMREVSYVARGIPSRAYPKWLVLHFVWEHLRPLLGSRSASKAFVEISEKNVAPLRPLSEAIDAVFKASLRFYKQKRKGVGEKAQDVSTFFKGRALDAAFKIWWRSSHNKDRLAFQKRWKAFEIAFKAAIG